MGKENNSSKEPGDASSPKKRKKEASSNSSISKLQPLPAISTNTDIYKEVILNEEEEALARDPNADLEIFCKTSENLRTLAKEINELKTSNPSQTSPQIIEKRIQASLLFVVLKKLNRLEKFRTNQNRDKLHKAKQQADSCHLQLQNLLYEILHLEKEITKCLQFKSKDEEIDLVSVDQFYEEAPKSVSRPEVTKVDSHQLKLARLEWELKQRKQLAALCHDLQSEKEKVAAGINKKQTQLDNLAPMLKDLFVASKPVQEALGLASWHTPFQQRVAEQLPSPLYFLFVQADALREAGDKNISVKIEGDEEEIQRMKQTLSEPVPDDSDSDAQEDNGREGSKRHHGHRKKSRHDRLQERRRRLLLAHPLSVVLTITLKDGQGSISLEFSYLVALHVVTVKPRVKLSPQINVSAASSVSKLVDSEHVLTELFPEDFGDGSPNTANYYQLKQVGIDSFDSSQLGLAYVWAQRVCGLNFVSGQGEDKHEIQACKPLVPSRQVCQLSLPNTIAAVKQRLKARISLCAQIQTLEAGKVGEAAGVRRMFPAKLVAELAQWTALSWSQYTALGFTSAMVHHRHVSERDLLYRGTLQRGSARLTFVVAIKNCYPLLPPVFALQVAYENRTIQASNNDSVRDIEREVNVYFKELIEKTRSVEELLTAQVLRLVTNFDILLEASSNQDFPRDKIFIKSNRGRNRAWPFKQMALSHGEFHFSQR